MRVYEDCLFEMGCEELPPKALFSLMSSLRDEMTRALKEASLTFDSIEAFASPRRLAVRINALASKQEDKTIERRGPAVSSAFTAEGQPTPAALGFAQSCGLKDVSACTRLKTDKGEWLMATVVQLGEETTQLLPAMIHAALKRLPIPKPMRWSDRSAEFIRPVHWIVLLFGDSVVEAEILDIKAGRTTYGHRFLAPAALSLKHPKDYEARLKSDGFVIADFNLRRDTIANLVTKTAKTHHAEVVMEPALLDEVTGLVEWPVPLLGSFDKSFLRVPEEALIAAMRDHQKCFYLVDEANHLKPHFITVSNIISKNEALVIAGNERVMRARLSDAAFFYDMDLKQTLESHLPKLKTVTFQAGLGTLYDRSVRLSSLAHIIAEHIDKPSAEEAMRAGLLSKCDLLSDMVGEFPELQGIMGRYYALAQKEPDSVATALEEYYHPRFAKDSLPKSVVGAALSLAERLDLLVGIFGVGQKPSGDKDPFGLRRAALGIVRILVEKHYDLDLVMLLEKAFEGYATLLSDKTVIATVHQYIIERLRAWYGEAEIPADVFAAVISRQSRDFADLDQRLQAVVEFRQLEQAQSLAAANKRVSNLLQKEGKLELVAKVDPKLLDSDAERQLADILEVKNLQIPPLCSQGKYKEALNELAELREPVDLFFDKVMVMVEQDDVRDNRLAMLAQLRNLFLRVADISLLQ